MKIFSRKAMATAAAAGFMAAGAFAAPAMAQETPTTVTTFVNGPTTATTVVTTGKTTNTVTSPMPDRPFNEASSGPEGEDGAGRFQEWMKLVTAVIGILTAVIGLASQVGRLFL